MTIQLVVQQNKQPNKIHEISQIVGDITYTTQLGGQAGKLEFTLNSPKEALCPEGSAITFKVDNLPIFFGTVFSRSVSDEKVDVVAYDQTRFLQNKDTIVVEETTASKLFSKICTQYNLPHRIITPSKFILPAKVEDNTSLYTMIDNAMQFSKDNENKQYIIRDNFGVIEFTELSQLKTNFVLGSQSMATGYTYKISIDEDTYNKIKIIKEDSDKNKRYTYIAQDGANMKAWGTLQYVEKVELGMPDSRVKAYANNLLTIKNRPTKKLSIEAIGNPRLNAGNGVIVSLDYLAPFGMDANRYFVIEKCDHTWKSNGHTMNLDLRLQA